MPGVYAATPEIALSQLRQVSQEAASLAGGRLGKLLLLEAALALEFWE